jgi:hypothetical protein
VKRPWCPAWCDRRHVKYGSPVHSARRFTGGVAITVGRGPGEPRTMHFNGVQVRMVDVYALAATMKRLGHPEIARAVDELTAVQS